jgi:TolB-like protein
MMRARKTRLFVAGLVALSLTGITGCENTQYRDESEPTYEEAALYKFIQTNYKAADALLGAMLSPASTSNFTSASSGSMLVATLADINRLEQSSALGRIITEHLSSRLAQRGRSVVEMKLRSNVFVRNDQGEFLLTRKFRELALEHNASAVVVGTYTDGGTFVFVSLKLIDPASGLILSAHDYTLPMDRQVRQLVSKERR